MQIFAKRLHFTVEKVGQRQFLLVSFLNVQLVSETIAEVMTTISFTCNTNPAFGKNPLENIGLRK